MTEIAHTGIPQRRGLKIGKRASKLITRVVVITILGLGAIAVMVPFIWMVSTSLKGEAEVLTFPPEWIPSPAYWDNYVKAVTVIPFATYLKNTLRITFVRLIGTVLSSALVAYSFARLRAPGLNMLFLVVLSTMMLPGPISAAERSTSFCCASSL
jgi:multiple sugar transport system permease protein